MLEITIPRTDLWDERNQRFIPVKEQKLRLEHSLVSLSKWESKWCKVFLSKEQKTIEETIDYIRCMTLTQNVDPLVYRCITNSHIDAVNAYIEAPMTASIVKEEKGGPINRQQITSELIYYWMTAYHIPFECQKWHLNRLLMLIRICNAENKPPKKRKQTKDLYRHHAEVNLPQTERNLIQERIVIKMAKSRQAVVNLVESWDGKKESNGSHKSIIDLYNDFFEKICAGKFPRGIRMRYDWAWCACTWSALAAALRYESIMPMEISCYYLIEEAKKMGCWQENDAYVPSPWRCDFV